MAMSGDNGGSREYVCRARHRLVEHQVFVGGTPTKPLVGFFAYRAEPNTDPVQITYCTVCYGHWLEQQFSARLVADK